MVQVAGEHSSPDFGRGSFFSRMLTSTIVNYYKGKRNAVCGKIITTIFD